MDGTRLRCEVDNAALNEVLRRLTAAGVRTLTCRPPTLEELFLRQYSDQDHDSERDAGDSGTMTTATAVRGAQGPRPVLARRAAR